MCALAPSSPPGELIYPVEPMAPEHVAQVAQSAQIATIMQLSDLALRRPRNEGRSLERTLASVDDSSWWSIPNRGDGPSVNIARTGFQKYGNAALIPNYEDIEMPDGKGAWRITVLVIDMETLCVQTASGTVAKPERRGNEKDLAYTQRCFQMQLAFGGRLERNAIFKILPGHWKDQIENQYKKVVAGKPLGQRIPILMEKFASIGVTEVDVKRLLGVAPRAMTEPQFGELCGTYNAIYTKEITADEAFKRSSAAEMVDDIPDAEPKSTDFQAAFKNLQAAMEAAGVDEAQVMKECRDAGVTTRKKIQTCEPGELTRIADYVRNMMTA